MAMNKLSCGMTGGCLTLEVLEQERGSSSKNRRRRRRKTKKENQERLSQFPFTRILPSPDLHFTSSCACTSDLIKKLESHCSPNCQTDLILRRVTLYSNKLNLPPRKVSTPKRIRKRRFLKTWIVDYRNNRKMDSKKFKDYERRRDKNRERIFIREKTNFLQKNMMLT